MRLTLGLVIAFALLAASASSGARTTARIWLQSPTAVSGSGFPPGKVRVTAPVRSRMAVKVVKASRTGRFVARFESPIKAYGCNGSVVTAVGVNGVRAVSRVPGNARDCPQPAAP